MTTRLPNVDEHGNFLDPQVIERLRETLGATTGGGSTAASLVVEDAVGEYAWNYPMAMHRTTPSSRTYFGATDKTGNLLACYFDHGTGKSRRQVIGTSSVVDDHHIPTASVPEGAPQVWVWNNHNRDTTISYRVGDRTGDLETLGPVRTVSAGGNVSYAAIIRNPGDPLELWMLNRTWPASSPYNWTIRRGVIDETALLITWDPARQFIVFPTNPTVQGYVTVVPVALPEGAYGFRFAVTGNPGGVYHDVLYGTVNLTTGAVESPTKTLTADVKTGAGLPLTVTDLAVAWTAPAGTTTRLFGTRDAGAPAMALATWPSAETTPNPEYRHVVYNGEGTEGAGLHFPSTSAYATLPPSTELQAATDLSVRLVFTPSGSTNSKTLLRRYGTAGQHVLQFNTLSTGTPRLLLYPSGAATPNVTVDASVAPSFAAGTTVGIGFDLDTTADIVRFYTSADAGATWVQLGTDRPATGAALLQGSPLPLSLGTSGASTLGHTQRLTITSLDKATTYVDQEFTASLGGWTLYGDASNDADTPGGWVSEAVGNAGGSFGGPNSPSYIGGLTYPTPAKGDLLYRSRESAGTWYLEKVSKAAGSWQARVLDQSMTHKLVRPNPIESQGPLELIYTAFSDYAGYTSFQGHYRGV